LKPPKNGGLCVLGGGSSDSATLTSADNKAELAVERNLHLP
jgi:hypothetical protein